MRPANPATPRGPSFEFFFVLLCIWVVQTQCIIQIIINRIALLVRDQKNINRLKWGCAAGLGLVNISVFCIWIPARLQISSNWIHINEIWDRIEKVIFCLIDAGLNLYFIYLVRSKLISNGLTKYHRLFRFNLFMIACSVGLDVRALAPFSHPSPAGGWEAPPLAGRQADSEAHSRSSSSASCRSARALCTCSSTRSSTS